VRDGERSAIERCEHFPAARRSLNTVGRASARPRAITVATPRCAAHHAPMGLSKPSRTIVVEPVRTPAHAPAPEPIRRTEREPERLRDPSAPTPARSLTSAP